MSDLAAVLFKPLEKLEETLGECFEFLECEREARVRAGIANRQKDEFLMIVAHELRNSMKLIARWLEMLQCEKLNEQAARRAIESINRSVKRQAELIEELLDPSQISSGKLRLNLREIEIAPVVEGVLNDFKVLTEARQIYLEAIFAPNLGQLTVDSHRLEQVLWNLLENAVEFTAPGGKICVAAERQEPYLEITVSNTGQGIDSEFLPFVFEPFRQVELGANATREDLGIGLSIVRRMVELHGGSVKADNAGYGQGAVVTIRLPKKPTAFNQANQPSPNKAAAGIGANEFF